MKTLYALTIAIALVGCAHDYTEATGTSSAFLQNCKIGTISTTITVEGIRKTLTITCTKDGN